MPTRHGCREQANDALWRELEKLSAARSAATKAAAEAEEAKAAVMQAGEVLMAELDDLHDARDHLTHRLARASIGSDVNIGPLGCLHR